MVSLSLDDQKMRMVIKEGKEEGEEVRVWRVGVWVQGEREREEGKYFQG